MRIIFIPGFGEDELVFSKLAPHIEGDKQMLNSWELLSDEPVENINALTFAREFITKYHITSRDVLVGHSMGGWIAYHVKHLINCRIVLIGSMTNIDRIIPPVINHPIIYWAIRKGLVFNRFTEWIAANLVYSNRSSRQIFLHVTGLLRKGNKNNIINQLSLALKPIDEAVSVQPDLRIHSANDTILRPPAEPYYRVPGDHFSLYTHPKDVYPPLVEFLRKCAANC